MSAQSGGSGTMEKGWLARRMVAELVMPAQVLGWGGVASKPEVQSLCSVQPWPGSFSELFMTQLPK